MTGNICINLEKVRFNTQVYICIHMCIYNALFLFDQLESTLSNLGAISVAHKVKCLYLYHIVIVTGTIVMVSKHVLLQVSDGF